jgi:prevent-host-death family protein
MKTANIAQVKESLAAYVTAAERGEEVVVCRRNRPAARLVAAAAPGPAANRTRLGTARGSVKMLRGRLTDPLPSSAWGSLA